MAKKHIDGVYARYNEPVEEQIPEAVASSKMYCPSDTENTPPHTDTPHISINDIAQDSGFETESQMPTIIKVVGVGGGGSNAVGHMYRQNINNVSFAVVNTDRQALNTSPVPHRVLIGPGLGAGGFPEVACQAAEESSEQIAQLFDDDTKMVFITAGMGGGTGTGAAPVVARIAHDKGVLTIGIVTIPFLFEGQKKIIKALAGAKEMSKHVDALLLINNQRLIDIYPNLEFNDAFAKADDTLSTAARSISELITSVGKINLDFNDVNATLRNGGVAIISTGYGEGENRVSKALDDALNSPLLKDSNIFNSNRILINIYFNPSSDNPFQMSEMMEINQFMANFSNDVDVITGVAHDTALENRIKITLLTSGFDSDFSDSVPAPTKNKPHAPVNDDSKNNDFEDTITNLYGKDKIIQGQNAKAEAQFIIISKDDIENDALLDELRNSPAFGRSSETKNRIRKMSEASNATPHKQHPAKHNTTGSTIRFDDE